MAVGASEQVAVEPRTSEWVAHGLLVATACAWSAGIVASKFVLDDVPPMLLAFIRCLLASVFLLVVVRARGIDLRVSAAELRLLALLGALGVSYFYIGSNLGLRWTTATTASLLLLPFPAITAIGARLFLGEHLNLRRIAGIAVALLGAAFLTIATSTGGFGGSLLGNLLILSTTLTWTSYTLIGRNAFARWPLEVSTTWIMLTGTLAVMPFALGELALGSRPNLSLAGLAIIVFIAVASTAAPYLMWNRGVETVGATRASIYMYLQPVAVMLMAFPVLGERPGLVTLAGGTVVVAGTFLVARR